MNVDDAISDLAGGKKNLKDTVDALLEAAGPVRKFAAVTMKNVPPEKKADVAKQFGGGTGEERMAKLRELAQKKKS